MTALALDLIAVRARRQYRDAVLQCLAEHRRFNYITA
jgi:hypothetical protein